MEEFFELKFRSEKKEVFIEALDKYDDQLLKTGKYVPKEPFNMQVSEGSIWYDIVRFQDPFNFAISEKVLNTLNNCAFTGWRTYEIELSNNSEKKYYGFQVLGRSGDIIRPPETGFIVGQDIEFSTWDGSDFFCPENTMLIFCTKRVKEYFINNQISNIKFQNIKTVRWYNI